MARSKITRTHIEIDAHPVPLVARVNRRAKRLILKVDPIAGEIFVTAPSQRAIPDAIKFARDSQNWIARQLDETLRARAFSERAIIPFRGIDHAITRDGGARTPVSIRNGAPPEICVGGDEAHLNRRVIDWMKREARSDFTSSVQKHCRSLGREIAKIRVRDARTRWGSCSSDGVLSFTWRLIMAPPYVLDYVAAHECAHLNHMHHGPAFWREVTNLGVNARHAEDWLSANGQQLFSLGVQS